MWLCMWKLTISEEILIWFLDYFNIFALCEQLWKNRILGPLLRQKGSPLGPLFAKNWVPFGSPFYNFWVPLRFGNSTIPFGSSAWNLSPQGHSPIGEPLSLALENVAILWWATPPENWRARQWLTSNRSPQSAEVVTKRKAEMRTWLKGKFKGRRLLKNPRDHYK